MTEITRWRDPSVKPHRLGPLPEPPRTHHTSKTEEGLTSTSPADAE